VADDAEGVRFLHSACGGAGQLVGSADEEVSRGWIAAALGAHIAELGEGVLTLVLLGRHQDPHC